MLSESARNCALKFPHGSGAVLKTSCRENFWSVEAMRGRQEGTRRRARAGSPERRSRTDGDVEDAWMAYRERAQQRSEPPGPFGGPREMASLHILEPDVLQEHPTFKLPLFKSSHSKNR